MLEPNGAARACTASKGALVPSMSVAELREAVRERRARIARQRAEEEKEAKRNKRKDFEEAMNIPSDEQKRGHETVFKKRKTRLESCREPIGEDIRGTKRSSPSSSFSSSSSTTASSATSLSPTAKKQKQTHIPPPSPFAFVPGTKRPASYSGVTATKKVCIAPAPTFGEASFLAPPLSIVGPIMRKRDADVYVEGAVEGHGFKRRRAVWKKDLGGM
ncbi:hypothetical protein BDW02DRAFT_142370 [Decorospora gaudefroyi]|uniref:Uncharacterized protein n=1 Tax=Decorospora gaudefroyi TaxID=184978 RepID=A0A6A5KJY1_9PLEO|nr:hypothetical protein BDW02DRAFT_142370 [Decorospora gaudefroyi]